MSDITSSSLKITLFLLFDAKLIVNQGNQKAFHYHCLHFGKHKQLMLLNDSSLLHIKNKITPASD